MKNIIFEMELFSYGDDDEQWNFEMLKKVEKRILSGEKSSLKTEKNEEK